MKQITLLLTGYIGSGKTITAKYISECYGIPVFYSDEEAKRLYDDPKFLSQVNEIVGGGIIASDGTLNKKALAEIIFSDDTKKQQVETLVHPKVRENFKLWKETKISPIVIMESAIALQNGREGFDYVVFVDAPEFVRLERTMKRDKSSREKILSRMKSQRIDCSLVDFTIHNEFDFHESADNLVHKLITFNESNALFAGSFDPFTNGHLSILKKACSIFDSVYLCIANNADKKRRYSIAEMQEAIKQTISLNGLTNCEVVICDHLVADFCKELGVTYLIRGLRNTSDYMYEENISKINHEINPNLETVYLRGDDDVISSSMVYEFVKYGKSIEKFVPEPVLQVCIQ
jgi:pantetheine-phosphate adenylyltransferase/dephospho-CoA kinase